MSCDLRLVKLERLPVLESGKDSQGLRPGSRCRPWLWFPAKLVPFVDAREAYFEIERIRGGWRVIRYVDEPAHLRTVVLPDVEMTAP